MIKETKWVFLASELLSVFETLTTVLLHDQIPVQDLIQVVTTCQKPTGIYSEE